MPAKRDKRHMVAPGIGLGQQQFDGTLGLGQPGKGGGAGGIDGKDQHAVGGFLIAFQAQVGLADFQFAYQGGPAAAQRLPRGGGAQGGDQVDALA